MEAKQYILNKQNMTEDIKKEIKTYIETNEHENTTNQNLWYSVKVMLKGRFISIKTYQQKQEKTKINNLTLHLKQLEKKNARVRRKVITKVRS